jgi:P27 family predicted phage terminase small subunit
MAKRGRRPIPTKLKIARGTLRKDRQRADEPDLPRGMPAMPERLAVDPIAVAQWHELSKALFDSGVLTTADGEALATLCEVHSAEQACLLELRATGPTIHTDLGGVKPNPAGSLYRSLAALKGNLLSEFGLTPSSRSKVGTSKDDTPKDDLEAFFTSHG